MLKNTIKIQKIVFLLKKHAFLGKKPKGQRLWRRASLLPPPSRVVFVVKWLDEGYFSRG
jgi:hypothetical protein